MCGIAGLVDLVGKRPVPETILCAMAKALFHRGPDEEGFLIRPGLGLASRRLSIVGLEDGQQPLANETGDVWVVFNGELFDYPEIRAELRRRGHRLVTHCDTELLPHLWEDQGEDMLAQLRGQFALALWDARKQQLLLARDRFGICPLYWTEQNGWLLFASEIKSLLASGMVEARPDLRGIDHIFTFMALPGPVTCFEGVQALVPGRFLRVQLGPPGQNATYREQPYWQIDFPDRGGSGERRGVSPPVSGAPAGSSRAARWDSLTDEFEALLLHAVERRLRADVPVAVCLSGGVDSCLVTAMASRLRGEPPEAFSVHVAARGMDESPEIDFAARSLHLEPDVLRCGRGDILAAYPQLVRSAESPVVDTSCAAVLLLSQNLHAHGYKVALTGQGADECLAGYVWFKIDKLFGCLDLIPGLRVSDWLRRAFMRLTVPYFPWSLVRLIEQSSGGYNPFHDFFSLMWSSRFSLFSERMHEAMAGRVAYMDLGLDVERVKRWHPMNRGLHLGVRTLLSGMLLSAKGDLASMYSSVELRHPFLDEDVFDFCAQLPPRAKLHGFRDKYLLRRVAERWLPRDIAWRRKTMFQAPRDSLFAPGAHGEEVPKKWLMLVEQLLSEESLRRTDYFDPQKVRAALRKCEQLRPLSYLRLSLELGLAGVVSTQLWHHTFIDGSLAELPSLQGSATDSATPAYGGSPG
jgi:asparagine synthase (glutamine-hydrolysing)